MTKSIGSVRKINDQKIPAGRCRQTQRPAGIFPVSTHGKIAHPHPNLIPYPFPM